MTINACSQHNVQHDNEQEPVSLLMLNADGSVTVHPALVSQFVPNMFSSIIGNSPAPTLHNVATFPGNSGHIADSKSNQQNVQLDHYAARRIETAKRGRLYASFARRLVREMELARYEALKEVSDCFGENVTDVRMLVMMHNKALKKRAKSMRQNLVWQKHCRGMSDKQIANVLNIHAKTVSKDRKEILQRHNGVSRNVR